MKRKLFLTFLLIATICLGFIPKIDDTFDALIQRLKAYSQKYPQEKVHLHLDKPYYAVGDNIWFKAYVLNTETLGPSEISDIIYVELINERDSVKKMTRLPLRGGISWGDFKLTDSLKEGNYRIRAYTQWMRNAGTDFFFDKTIKIGNSWANKVFTNTSYTFSKENAAQKVSAKILFTDKEGNPYAATNVNYEVQLNFRTMAKGKVSTNEQGEANISFLNTMPSLYKSGKITATITLANNTKVTKEIPVKATSESVDVQFFPESGNLVEGLPNKIGIKAVNASGLGEDVSGVIVDNSGTEISNFTTTYRGMGNFILNPQPGKTYQAKVKYRDGSEQSVNLPIARTSGYVLTVNNTDKEKVNVRILMTPDLVGNGELKLLAQHSNNVYFSTRAVASKQVVSASFPKKEIPAGILQFTLFSADNKPVAERLTFIKDPTDQVKATLTSDKQTYAKREKVKLNLETKTDTNRIQGSYSVSVTNTASVKPDPENESNIFTTMLLTSDLIGYIEKPNYYFLNDNAEINQHLDNLMITQGWRRVLWQNIINNAAPIIRFDAEKGISISGTINTYGGKPVPNAKVSLFSSSGGLFVLDTVADIQGRFNFSNLVFPEGTQFIVQGRTAKNKKGVDVKLDIVPGQVVTKNSNTGDIEVNVNEAIQSYLTRSVNYFDELAKRGLLERSLTLDEVKIVEKKNPAKNSANLNGAGNADAVINADQLSTCFSLSQCLQGRIAGLIITNGKAFLMRNSGRGAMTIYLDGVNVGDDFLDNINPTEVETIEILKSANYLAMYGSNGGNGVILITTKRGGSYATNSNYTPGIVTYNPRGYYISREFYSPKYDTPEASQSPDLRSTVYWNPALITNPAGKASFEFFNTDEPGTYRVVLEGMDVAGNLARTVYTYEVK